MLSWATEDGYGGDQGEEEGDSHGPGTLLGGWSLENEHRLILSSLSKLLLRVRVVHRSINATSLNHDY